MVLLVQLLLGGVDQGDDFPALGGHLEEVVGQKLLCRPALVHVDLKCTRD